MPRKRLSILHLRGKNGSQYARIGVYAGGELPKEYRGVGTMFNANPNIQEITITSANNEGDPDCNNTDHDVFTQAREGQVK